MGIFDLLKRRVEQPAIPPPEWIKFYERLTAYTPDYWSLQRYEAQLLFVYGEDKMSFPRNEQLLDVCEPLYTAFTYENFTMWNHLMGGESYPITMDDRMGFEERVWFKNRHDHRWAKIKGELYAVPPNLFLELDRYRENGVKFRRQRTQIIISYRHSRYPHILRRRDVKAWMYTGMREYWEDLIDTGLRAPSPRFAPARMYKNEKGHGKEYFCFTLMDLKQQK